MRRAEKNVDGILEDLNDKLHRIRQESIDEELFDVLSGYETLTAVCRPRGIRGRWGSKPLHSRLPAGYFWNTPENNSITAFDSACLEHNCSDS